MERGFSLGLILLILAGITSTLMSVAKAATPRQIVLVTFGECCPNPLSSLQIRKLYLGIGISSVECQPKPVRNLADPKLDLLFVQSVMSMAPRTYERRLLLSLFREGRPRPENYDTEERLLEAFRDAPCALTYMWRYQAESLVGAKIVQILWTGFTDP